MNVARRGDLYFSRTLNTLRSTEQRNKSRSGHKTPIRGICISFPMFSEKDDNISDFANVSTITACGFDLARSESGRSGVSRND